MGDTDSIEFSRKNQSFIVLGSDLNLYKYYRIDTQE